ncbi:hypothetical protein [Sinorhizobium meliloti]|uniref:hypothetical protein n=1 Tax=Rhizobium meliloti TaxID=382 RepID=UPI000FDBB46A|nr:hypothetical protein [Sinorhizobium meliloti]RVM22576.1 hypothetical protein CN132_25825 [Sinorhizobium meliloti]
MIHYHGTPISPVAALLELAGRHFCVSFARPDDVVRCHQIGQSVMLDNGAFSAWRNGIVIDWTGYYRWCERWLASPSTWAVIPDEIDGGALRQDALLAQWPFGNKGAPVWHMDEPPDRLLRLVDHWPRVCIGSTKQYATILSTAWQRRMDETWNALGKHRRFLPSLHMLRGMQLVGHRWRFASADSSDIGRNHNRPQNAPRAMADRWDRCQVPLAWEPRPEQAEVAL